jgi:hypothetical protein
MVIANLSNLCWSKIQQSRNQAIFKHLLLDTDSFEEGFFIQPPMVKTARTFRFSRTPQLEIVSRPDSLGRPVTVVQPVLTLPSGYPSAAVGRSIAELGQKLVREVFRGKPYLLWINSMTHFQAQLAEQLMPGSDLSVFDGSDLYLMYQRNGGSNARQAEAILKSSDVAICSNEQSFAQIPHPMKSVLSHYTEFKAFQQKDEQFQMSPLFPKPKGKKYVGFTGMLAPDRIDFDLLIATVTRFPRLEFIFVGSTNRPNLLARLKEFENFHYIPEVSQEVLSSIIHQFDVAIVPELDNNCTRGSNGKKILDYLACGVRVLSTLSPTGEKFGKSIQLAGSIWDFCNQLDRLVTENRLHTPQFGQMIAQKNSWSSQVPSFMDWLFERQREQARSSATVSSRLTATVKAYL